MSEYRLNILNGITIIIFKLILKFQLMAQFGRTYLPLEPDCGFQAALDHQRNFSCSQSAIVNLNTIFHTNEARTFQLSSDSN